MNKTSGKYRKKNQLEIVFVRWTGNNLDKLEFHFDDVWFHLDDDGDLFIHLGTKNDPVELLIEVGMYVGETYEEPYGFEILSEEELLSRYEEI